MPPTKYPKFCPPTFPATDRGVADFLYTLFISHRCLGCLTAVDVSLWATVHGISEPPDREGSA